MNKIWSSVLFIVTASQVHANCTDVLALSKVVSEVVQSRDELESYAKSFCKEYKKSTSSQKSANYGASYKFLSASMGKSGASASEVASRYCSDISGRYEKNDAYRQYVETIAPGAYSAFVACERMRNIGLSFGVDEASLLPKEFTISASFTPTTTSTAELMYQPSNGVTCSWQKKKKDKIILQPLSSSVLHCSRSNASDKSYVTVVNLKGKETITIPWQAYGPDGAPVDVVKALLDKSEALEKSFVGAVVSFERECPPGWDDYKPAYGRFIRGLDKSGSKVDPDGKREFRVPQTNTFASHSHKANMEIGAEPWTGAAEAGEAAGAHGRVGKMYVSSGLVRLEGEAETRPKNVALLYCKKLP